MRLLKLAEREREKHRVKDTQRDGADVSHRHAVRRAKLMQQSLGPRLAQAQVVALKEVCGQELAMLNKLQDGRNKGNIAFQNRKYAEAVAAYTYTMQLAPHHSEYMAALFCNRAAAQVCISCPSALSAHPPSPSPSLHPICFSRESIGADPRVPLRCRWRWDGRKKRLKTARARCNTRSRRMCARSSGEHERRSPLATTARLSPTLRPCRCGFHYWGSNPHSDLETVQV
jgi:hypothetical protein